MSGKSFKINSVSQFRSRPFCARRCTNTALVQTGHRLITSGQLTVASSDGLFLECYSLRAVGSTPLPSAWHYEDHVLTSSREEREVMAADDWETRKGFLRFTTEEAVA